MRQYIELVESLQSDPITDIISAANFSIEECDDINHGECGTFAVLLFSILETRGIDCRIGLIARSDSDDKSEFGNRHSLYWGHMFIERGGRFYDIEGEVEMPHMISNYLGGYVEAGYVVKPFFFDNPSSLYRKVRIEDVVNDAVLLRLRQRFEKAKLAEGDKCY